jgi:sec-independent protein translocase protein TatB
MLDIGFSELVVIGVVALIVIGPERLPRVARTAGHLLGRFQRYVADVKADINREMELSDLKKLQTSVEDAARSIQQSVKTGVEDAAKEFQEAQAAVENTGAELRNTGAALEKTGDEIKQAVSGIQMPHMGTAPQIGTTLAPPVQHSPAGIESGSSLTANAEDEGPSPQLELGLQSAAQPGTQKQA